MTRRPVTRRRFLTDTAVAAAATAAMRASDAGAAVTAGGKLPTISLGKLKVSRLILGSNPFFGFAHRGKGLGARMKAYYTDQRIMTVLDEAAEMGITAVAAPVYDRWIKLFAAYLDKGGKLKTWIAQPDPPGGEMSKAITAAAKGGATAIFIQGARVDEHVGWNRWDRLLGWVKQVRDLGLPAGMASHRPDVHVEAEKRKFPTDFYYQCFFQAASGKYLMKHRDLAVAAIRQIDKPVVGYKVLAAGRLEPDQAFAFAFEHIRAKDGVCVGVYPPDKEGMIAQDAGLVRKLSGAPAGAKVARGRKRGEE